MYSSATNHVLTTSWKVGVETESYGQIMIRGCREREIDDWVEHVCKAATECGRLDILRHLRDELTLDVSGAITRIAAKEGHS